MLKSLGLLAITLTLVARTTNAQTAVLSLDTDPANRCMKSSQSGLWIVRNPEINTPQNPNLTFLTVTLHMTPTDLSPARDVVRYLAAGKASELGCAAGHGGASYQIVYTER